MTFCTSIHCMDGRIQEPLIKYLKENYGITYVDTITEPGPCKVLAENKDKVIINSILKRLEISIYNHGSQLIAVSGHYDCAGNSCGEEIQKKQIKKSVEHLKSVVPEMEIIGLWVDQNWKVHTVYF